MRNARENIERHCREVIRQCHYIAIHKDDETECIVLVTMLHTQPVMSVIVADKLAFAAENEDSMYRLANDLNRESLTGWHTLLVEDDTVIYMYRQCLWMTKQLTREHLMEILCNCIAEYKSGKSTLTSG